MPINNAQLQVAEFMIAMGQTVRSTPTLDISEDEYELRESLIREEYHEFVEAMHEYDLTGIADALGDLIVVVAGTFHAFGLPFDAIMNEIHRSNMSKLDDEGNPVLREDGKVMKGPNYSPPNIAGIISKAQKGLL